MKLIVFKNGNVFLSFAPLCFFVDLLTSRIEDSSHIISNESIGQIVLFRFYLMRFRFCYDILIVDIEFWSDVCSLIMFVVWCLFLSILLVQLSTTFIGPLAWHYCIPMVVYWTTCMFLKFLIFLSFGSQLSRESGWAGSEPYVRTHITESPCFYLCFYIDYILA